MGKLPSTKATVLLVILIWVLSAIGGYGVAVALDAIRPGTPEEAWRVGVFFGISFAIAFPLVFLPLMYYLAFRTRLLQYSSDEPPSVSRNRALLALVNFLAWVSFLVFLYWSESPIVTSDKAVLRSLAVLGWLIGIVQLVNCVLAFTQLIGRKLGWRWYQGARPATPGDAEPDPGTASPGNS